MSDNIIIHLISEAIKIRENAYSPYSNYCVGAAVLCGSGKIYTGCNVENASYGLSCCAERNAVFNAVSHGERVVKAVAIVGGHKDKDTEYAYPCGACRQVLNEFSDQDTMIYVARTKDDYKTYSMAELLPESFKL